MNLSFFLGILRGLLIGIALCFPAIRPLTSGLNLWLALSIQFSFAVIVAVLYMLWVSHNTPTKSKTAIKLFGTKLWRAGPSGKGLVTGLNTTLFGWPIMIVEDKSTEEKTHCFAQMAAFSDDRIGVKIDGTFNYFIDDIYATYNISDEDAEQSVISTVKKWIRAKTEEFTAEVLISQEAGDDSAKIVLADRAYQSAHTELTGPKALWGRDITSALQINEIDPQQDYAAALRRRKQVVIEGESQQIQVDRRLSQLDQVKGKGVNPDLAAAFVQVEANLPGAKITTLNIPGAQGLGEGIARFSEVLQDFLKPHTEGNTP